MSLPVYTWHCDLNFARRNLQTVQDKDLKLTLENKTSAGRSIAMGDRSVKSDQNKKIFCLDATSLYGHAMSQTLTYDEIEMWHGHHDLYMNNLEEIINTPDDSGFGYSLEVDLRCPHKKKKKQRIFHFVRKIKLFIKINIMKK